MTAKKHSDRLKRMAKRTPQEITKALYAVGQRIELDAEKSITDGSISGAMHVPSRPGEPPNADTRFLDSNIETEIGGVGLVTVTSKAPYSAALEYGTGKMAARPFMRPALERQREKIPKALAAIINTTIK